MSDKLDFIKKIPFFKSLSNDDLEKIASVMKERQYKKNMILFMEGEPGEAIHFIQSGKVKIYKTSEDGREHILDIAGAGEIFAEVVLFNEVSYPATAEVIEDSKIAFIRNDDLERVLKNAPAIAVSIIKILNKRLIDAQTQVKCLALQDTHSRTAGILIKLAREYGEKTDKGIKLDMNISRQELANMVGTTRETVTRVLMSFKKTKILEIDKQSIIILDISELESWL